MSRDIVPLGLRMPPEVKEQIEAAAKANGRSMNAEIVARLQASFEQPASGTAPMDAIFDIARIALYAVRATQESNKELSQPKVAEAIARIEHRIDKMQGKNDG